MTNQNPTRSYPNVERPRAWKHGSGERALHLCNGTHPERTETEHSNTPPDTRVVVRTVGTTKPQHIDQTPFESVPIRLARRAARTSQAVVRTVDESVEPQWIPSRSVASGLHLLSLLHLLPRTSPRGCWRGGAKAASAYDWRRGGRRRWHRWQLARGSC